MGAFRFATAPEATGAAHALSALFARPRALRWLVRSVVPDTVPLSGNLIDDWRLTPDNPNYSLFVRSRDAALARQKPPR